MSKILIVDDDNLILGLLGRGLRQAGHQTYEADDSSVAQRLALREAPDLAILDIHMPKLNGLELAGWLDQMLGTPFVFLTAYSDDTLVARGVAMGALGYLVKPIEAAQLIPMVSAALALAAQRRASQSQEKELLAALQTNRDVSRAVGMLMERLQLSEEQAFERLRQCARASRMKLSTVACAFAVGDPVVTANLRAEVTPRDPGIVFRP